MIKSNSFYLFFGLIFSFWLIFSSSQVFAQQIDPDKIPYADGFDLPVGKPHGEGYYISRGIKGRHLGEDWNGVGGGNTDLGDPVYSVAHGLVISASDLKMGYGKTVFVVHKFREKGRIRIVETLYSHLHKISVSRGDVVRRGQKVGTIGTGNGLYTAHLHFELRDKPGRFVTIGYRKGREAFLDPFNFISVRRPAGEPDLILAARPGKFPGKVSLTRPTSRNSVSFLAENKNVSGPRAASSPIDINIPTPEDSKLVAFKKRVVSSIPQISQIMSSDKNQQEEVALAPTRPEVKESPVLMPPVPGGVDIDVLLSSNEEEIKKMYPVLTEKSSKEGTPVIETYLADAITEQKINQELGNLPNVVAEKYTNLRKKDDDRVEHFEQHMSNDSLDDREMMEAATQSEKLVIEQTLSRNRAQSGGLMEVDLDQLLVAGKLTSVTDPNGQISLSLIENPLELKAKKEISRAVGQVNDTATRLALFLNEVSKVQSPPGSSGAESDALKIKGQ